LLLKADGVLMERFNPLDDEPPEIILPSFWSAPHVFVRTADAFGILARMPLGRWGPTGLHNCWPEYYDEWADLLAQLGDFAGEVEKTWEARNRVHMRPSSQELAAMDSALLWPCRYLRGADEQRRALNLVAMANAQGRDLGEVLRRYQGYRRDRVALPRRSEQAWRKTAMLGADVIAQGLQRDDVPVF
jgi:hypothetical protein